MEWLVVLVAVSLIVGAFAQSVTGLGFSLIAAPAMLALLGPRDGVAMIVVLSALASFIPLTHQWRHIGFRDAGSLLLPTLLATPVVVAALAGADTALVAVGAGVAVLIGVFLLARGASWSWFRGLPGAIGAGIASAVLNVVGGVGGPPVGMYASNAGWAPDHSRATLQFFFLVQNLVTAVVIGFIAPQWWMLAGVVIGTLIGALVAGRIPVPAARMAVLVVAALGGASLVVANV
ncbi:MAG TPA: TSUP family transporter [Actinomycetota bacterium]|nr:TSUP family transporter [Actinomycetota bacterium]